MGPFLFEPLGEDLGKLKLQTEKISSKKGILAKKDAV